MTEDKKRTVEEILEEANQKTSRLLNYRWMMGWRDRGMGHGDYGIMAINGEKVLGEIDKDLAEQIIKDHNAALTVSSCPIYIISLPSTDKDMLLISDKWDITHAEFWDTFVSKRVAQLYGIDVEMLEELDGCMPRARILSNGTVYYGGEKSDALLKRISNTFSKDGSDFNSEHRKRFKSGTELQWKHDEIEVVNSWHEEIFKRILENEQGEGIWRPIEEKQNDE